MKGNRTGVLKVHCKSSGKSCSGKTNIHTTFFGDLVSHFSIEPTSYICLYIYIYIYIYIYKQI